jgi:acetoin:2,6-dichlorophenolindophenol oxidoreductase subunit alpha
VTNVHVISTETLLDDFRRMLEIRLFEDEVQQLFVRNLVSGSTHLYQGQEAVAVGVTGELAPGDWMTCTYRGHGAVLAMGAQLEAAFAEILGRAGGLCQGKGGSMHLADVERGALGSFATVGAGLPVAVGAALTAQIKHTGAVAVTFFGDGATNIGAFHESLNLASIWQLPCVFVCENNLYGEYSPIATTTAVERIADRAAAYSMPGVRADGNDIDDVRATAHEAVLRARDGGGPTLIEALTYRQVGHSRADPGTYRPDGELDAWLERDPIDLLGRRLSSLGVEDATLDRVRHAAEARVAVARDTALGWPEPTLASRLEGVYS